MPPIRSLKKAIGCSRCGEPLYYPSTLDRHSAILCCGRCGARTPVPAPIVRYLKMAGVLCFIVAIALTLYLALFRR